MSSLSLSGGSDLKYSISKIMASSGKMNFDVSLTDMGLRAEDLKQLENCEVSSLRIEQDQLDLSGLPKFKCDEFQISDSDGFSRQELAPLGRLKMKNLFIQKGGLTRSDVKFLTDDGIIVEWEE